MLNGRSTSAPERQLDKLLGAYQQAIAYRAQRLNHRNGKLDDPAVKEQLARYDAAKEWPWTDDLLWGLWGSGVPVILIGTLLGWYGPRPKKG